MLGSSVVICEVAHKKADIYIVVEEAGCHCNSFFAGDGLMCAPVYVVRPDPDEIVCGEATHHKYEVGYQWVEWDEVAVVDVTQLEEEELMVSPEASWVKE